MPKIEIEDRTDRDVEQFNSAISMLAAYLNGTVSQVIRMPEFPDVDGPELTRIILLACEEVISDLSDMARNFGYEIVRKHP